MTWSGAVLVAVLASAALAGAAQAQPSWQCSASAVSSSLAGNPGRQPGDLVGNPCVSNATGLDNLPAPARPARRAPSPRGRRPRPPSPTPRTRSPRARPSAPSAASRTSPSSSRPARARRRSASAPPTRRSPAICVAGSPVLDGSSEAIGVTIGGQEVPIEQAAQQLAQQLAPLGDVVDLKFDEQVRTGSSLTINALHLKVLSAAGTPVLDVIAGQAQTSATPASVCDPTRPDPDGRRQRLQRQAAAATARPTAPAAAPCWPTACAAAPAAS